MRNKADIADLKTQSAGSYGSGARPTPVEIIGTSGDDTLSSTQSDDVLTGGAGADVFVFNTLDSSGSDRITDFELDSDMLKLSGSSDTQT